MTLLEALLTSEFGIATRAKAIGKGKRGTTRYEHHCAVASNTKRGFVYIHNGRTGAIRKANDADRTYPDWQPFAQFAKPQRLQVHRWDQWFIERGKIDPRERKKKRMAKLRQEQDPEQMRALELERERIAKEQRGNG